MNATLEERVEALEKELSALKADRADTRTDQPVLKDWRSTFGWARNYPEFDRAMDAGEAYRKEQTVEQEYQQHHAGA